MEDVDFEFNSDITSPRFQLAQNGQPNGQKSIRVASPTAITFLLKNLEEINRQAKIDRRQEMILDELNRKRKGQRCSSCDIFFFEDEDPLVGGWCKKCHAGLEETQNEKIIKEEENGNTSKS